MMKNEIINQPLSAVVADIPAVADFLSSFAISADNRSFRAVTESLPDDYWQTNGITQQKLTGMFADFITGMEHVRRSQKIETLEVLAGIDKNQIPEPCSLLLKPGEVTCIVGPTGSGKSRLLADIEWLADGDTPTRRKILLNGELPDEDLRNLFGGKLVAQITQNMNFVLDMDVQSFLMLHAQSRFLENAEEKVDEVILLANELSGEGFNPQTPVTFLSGGQSRALMIADVACIGQAPVVLIDEIENAGVDKKKALELLISQEKIILMATHDPLLILQAERRVVIKNGGMQRIIGTNEYEKAFYLRLEKIDRIMQNARNFFRTGNSLTSFDHSSLDGN